MLKFIMNVLIGSVISVPYLYYGFIAHENKFIRVLFAIPLIYVVIRMLFNKKVF